MPTAFDPYYEWLGIPPKDQPPNHYRLLGIELFEENLNVIERAADRQMAHLRTLQTGKHGALSQELLNQVAAAKVCLLNPTKRAAYDAKLRDELAVKIAAAALPAGVSSAATDSQLSASPSSPAPAFVPKPVDRDLIRRPRSHSLSSKLVLVVSGCAAVILLGAVTAYVILGRGKPVATGIPPSPTSPSNPDGVLPEPETTNTQDNANAPSSETSNSSQVAADAAKNQSVATPPPATAPTSTAPKDNRVPVASRPSPENPASSAKTKTGSQQSIDLLQKFDVQKHTLQGATQFAGGVFSTETSEGPTQVIIPYTPPVAYDLEVHVKRLSGNDALNIGLFVSGRQGLLVIDGTANGSLPTCSAVLLKEPDPRRSDYPGTVYRQPVLLVGETIVVRCEVRGNQVTAYSGNDLLCQWSGDPQSLFLPDSFSLSDPVSLQIGSLNSRFAISKLELQPRAAALASNMSPPRPPPQSNIPSATKSNPKESNTAEVRAAASRAPVPDAQTQAAKLAQVTELHKDDIDKAKKPAEKALLAETLAGQARPIQDDLAARYVLFDQAREFAIQSGSLPLSLRIIDELDKQYEVDALSLKVDALQRVAESPIPLEQRKGLFESSLATAKLALDTERYDLAQAASKVADGAAARLRDAEARKTAVQLRTDITRRKAQWEEVQKALTRIQSEPENAAANLAVGKYYCFERNDWDKGLQHLAQGNEPLLAKAAELDLQAGGNAQAQFAAAEAWDEVASSIDESERPAIQRRAYHWYNVAANELTGLEKAKALQQLEALASTAISIHPVVSVTLANGSNAEVHPGLVGRVLVNGKDIGILVRYEPGTDIRQSSLMKLVQEAKVENVVDLQIELNGFFSLTTNSNVWIGQELGLPSGNLALLVAGAPFQNATPNDPQAYRVVPVVQGDHTITWKLQGDVSQSNLRATDPDTGERIPFYYTEELLERTRKPPIRGTKIVTKEVNLSEN